MVDRAEIESASPRCERGALPLSYRPLRAGECGVVSLSGETPGIFTARPVRLPKMPVKAKNQFALTHYTTGPKSEYFYFFTNKK